MTQPAWAFAVRGEGTDTLEIDILDVIEDPLMADIFGGVSAKTVADKIRGAKGVKLIKLRVNSPGGNVFEGAAIYSQLNDHAARVEADIDGLAASMASVVVMAADEIRMASGAMMMIHNPWILAAGDADELREVAGTLDKIRDTIVGAYTARTGIERDEVIAMMDAETWMTAGEAKAKGFADVVKPAKTKATEKALARLDLSKLANAPDPFRQAVAQAREATDRDVDGGAPVTETTASKGGAKQRKSSMNEDELRAQHPDLYAAVFGKGREEGVAHERKRVSAHFKMADAFGAVDVAKAAIMSGASVSDEEVQADYMAAGQKARDVNARQADDTTVGEALAGAATPTPRDDADEWLMAEGGA